MMKDYILGKEDFEQIDNLIRVTFSIDNLYTQMYNLEINGKKDTEEYKKLLDCLNKYIATEKKLYNNNNNLNYEKCVAWVTYLVKDRLPSYPPNNIDTIATQDYSNRIIKRILNILESKIISDNNNVKYLIPKEVVEKLKETEIPERVISESANNSVAILCALERDLINTYLTILQELILKDDYRSFRSQLINSKYNAAFFNKDIETKLLSSNFDIPDTLYIDSKLVADLHGLTTETYEKIKESYYTKISARQVSEVVEMGDMDYSDLTKATTSIIRQCLMRAAFSLMNDETLSEVNYLFHEFIEDKNYLDRHPSDRISQQLIVNCFNSIKQDRKKHNTLSLGYRKN